MENIDSYLFMLKKFLSGLLTPVPMVLFLLLWALLLLLRKKTRWAGYLFLLAGIALLFAASYAPISTLATSPLEKGYVSYQPDSVAADYIAVLGHGHIHSEKQPITSEISPEGIVRIVEGIRIYQLNPGSKIIFTGYSGLENNPSSYAEKAKVLALSLGVPDEDILFFPGPRDTSEEAELIANHFSGNSIVLVTSAAHMSRALLLFNREGLDPVPAPTHHRTKPIKSYWTFPSAGTLKNSAYWQHEKIGLIWAEITGKKKKYSSAEHTPPPEPSEK